MGKKEYKLRSNKITIIIIVVVVIYIILLLLLLLLLLFNSFNAFIAMGDYKYMAAKMSICFNGIDRLKTTHVMDTSNKMVYLTTHSIHFIYVGHMVKDHSDREETRWRHYMGYYI